MKKIYGLFALIYMLGICCVCSAADPISNKTDNIIFNQNVLYLDRDSDIYIKSLQLLSNNKKNDLENFMQYRLAEIVCASWDMIGSMNQSQKKTTMEMLQNIKKHTGSIGFKLEPATDPTKFSKYLGPYNKEQITRANDILRSLQ